MFSDSYKAVQYIKRHFSLKDWLFFFFLKFCRLTWFQNL